MLRARFASASFLRSRVVAVSLAAVTLAALVGAARTYSSGVRPGGAPATPYASASTFDHTKKPGRVVETELITLRATGFEPSEITRPAGEFILMVENVTGEPVNLRFDRETGERVHEMRMSREEPDWNESEDLRPGRYLMTEANHLDWVCRVTVTAR